MTEECITPLRQRMIEDMSVRHFASKTQHDYIRTVMKLTRFLGRSPDTATNEDLRRFQLHLTENRAGAPIINSTVSALRFFFTVTLGRADAARHLTFVHEPRKLPVVLSPEEVARLLEAAPGVKYKAALSVAYGAGLRISEVVSLKVSDIDSKRMMLRVAQGKGGKDRHAMLSPQLLELLRDWWRIARPQVWLFPGLDPINPMSTRQLHRACHAAAQMAEIAKRVSLKKGSAQSKRAICLTCLPTLPLPCPPSRGRSALMSAGSRYSPTKITSFRRFWILSSASMSKKASASWIRPNCLTYLSLNIGLSAMRPPSLAALSRYATPLSGFRGISTMARNAGVIRWRCSARLQLATPPPGDS
jgi:site-specific recombinase XerD